METYLAFVEIYMIYMLGAMQPGFGPAYECSYNVSPDETKAHGDGLTQQEPVDFGTAQNRWDCTACILSSL